MRRLSALLLIAGPVPALAQHAGHMTMPAPQPPPAMPMDHAAMGHDMSSMQGMGSGSSRLPGTEAMRGVMQHTGGWMLMAHGYAWGVYSDQGGPRGDSKAFVASMGMLTASRPVADGVDLQLRAMLSLDPLIGDRGYPNLFATGETAGGVPLVDRQHPHDFFMELSGRIDVDIAPDTRLFLYGGPVAEPALGPSAFMHRQSARLNPEAPITHHWFDSTHISFGVVTVGVTAQHFQLETSAFRGREPDEARWDIETPKLDSWSVRATWLPVPQIAAQISHGRIKEPETLHPGEDESRTTASVSWTGKRIALTAAYARKNRLPGPALDAWLAEATWDITPRHALFGRYETVENDELFGEGDPLHDRIFRVGKATLGYAYTLPLGRNAELALGGSASLYAKPAALDGAYGKNPKSFTLFAKMSLGR